MTDVFGVMMIHTVLPDHVLLNRDLLAFIKDSAEHTTPLENGPTHAGFQGTYDLDRGFWSVDETSVKKLEEKIKTIFKQWVKPGLAAHMGFDFFNAWTIIYQKGSYQTPHLHPDGDFSGVYIVKAPDGKDRVHMEHDHLVLLNPYGNKSPRLGFPLTPPQQVMLPTPEGSLIIIPSWLMHYVAGCSGERVVVAFDIKITGIEYEAGPRGGQTAVPVLLE